MAQGAVACLRGCPGISPVRPDELDRASVVLIIAGQVGDKMPPGVALLTMSGMPRAAYHRAWHSVVVSGRTMTRYVELFPGAGAAGHSKFVRVIHRNHASSGGCPSAAPWRAATASAWLSTRWSAIAFRVGRSKTITASSSMP